MVLSMDGDMSDEWGYMVVEQFSHSKTNHTTFSGKIMIITGYIGDGLDKRRCISYMKANEGDLSSLWR